MAARKFFYNIYPVVYGSGLLVLITSMMKMLFPEIAEVHRKQTQDEIYKEMRSFNSLMIEADQSMYADKLKKKQKQ